MTRGITDAALKGVSAWRVRRCGGLIVAIRLLEVASWRHSIDDMPSKAIVAMLMEPSQALLAIA